MKPITIQVACDCKTEILELMYWPDDEPRMYYITLYKASAGMGFWWRLKQAIRYFFYGEFNGNAIVLQKPEYDKFVDVLNEHRIGRI